MDLPERFSVRIKDYPGLTHGVKRNDNGMYEMKWSRGFFEALCDRCPLTVGAFRNREIDEKHMQAWLESGDWLIVDDSKKERDVKLPDEASSTNSAASLPSQFYFTYKDDNFPKFKATLSDSGEWYEIDWEGRVGSSTYSTKLAQKFVTEKYWKIIDKKPLTAEQRRFNSEFREQIRALGQSIKLNENDIEHKIKLIDSYNERIEQLKAKIVEEV